MRKSLTDDQVRAIRQGSPVAGVDPGNAVRIRQRKLYASVPDEPLTVNGYHTGDAIAFLGRFSPGQLAGVATSPPYNKAFRGRSGKSNWGSSKLFAGEYANRVDELPHDAYVEWQRQFLDAALRAVGDDGVVLYNTAPLHAKLGVDLRHEIIDGFPLRQLIIWDRGSSNNQGGVRPSLLPPSYELVYLLAGQEWRLPERHLSDFRKWGAVWRIPPERNPHPAPFPLALAERMCMLADGPVADPFAGSGTVGVACARLGLPYYLSDADTSGEYRQMFEERTQKPKVKTDPRPRPK